MWDVVGVGANSIDYVYRLPAYPRPDSPTAKLRIASHLVSPGGQVATTLCTCATLGLRVRYVGTAGDDDNAARIRAELARRGVDVEHLVTRNAASPFAVILLDGQRGERVVLWDRDPRLALRPDDLDPAVVTDARLVHVDDVDADASIRAAALARNAGLAVTSDIERMTERTEELVAAVTIPIFDEHVLEPLTGERDSERALRRLRHTHAGVLVATLGARGAMLLDGDRLHHEPALPVTPIDTTGAGDVFRGAFIAALLRGDGPAGILRFANAAAAVSCTRLGAMNGVPSLEEVHARLLAPEGTEGTEGTEETD
jgi:sugar/nucleoside kinase (ribokinase family)